MTSTYQPYRPGVIPLPGFAEPAAKSPLENKPLLLTAAITGGVSAALLVWAVLPSAAGESSADIAPASAVAPADPVPAENHTPPAPLAPALPPPPVAPAAPVPAPPPPAAVPAAPSAPSVITFDGGTACFPFQPDC